MTLLPRTGSTAPSTPGSSDSAAESKASPFGAARPVDLAAKEKEVEEKLAKQAAEAKEKREAKQAEIKAAREKEAADKAAAAAAGAVEGGAPAAGADKKAGGPRGAKSPSTEPANWRSAKSSPAAAVAPPLEPVKSAKPAAADKKKETKKDFSFASLAVEGGDDEDVDEVAEGIKKVEV